MTTSAERNQSHLTFYESLVRRYPKEFQIASHTTSVDELKKVIVLDMGESTILHLSGLAFHTLTEDIPFVNKQFEKHKDRMRVYLKDHGLPEEILDLAIQFGIESFEKEQSESQQ